MNQSFVTIVAPIDLADVARGEAACDRMGNPARPAIRAALDVLDPDGSGIHFISLHAITSFTPGKAYLLLEMSVDGTAQRGINQLAAAIGSELATIFALATDWQGTDLATYLVAHAIEPGHRYGSNPGVCHAGTPGMPVGRIRDEFAIVNRIKDWIAEPGDARTALDRVDRIRQKLAAEGMVLPRGDAEPDFTKAGLFRVGLGAASSFAVTYLWPAALLLVLLGLITAVARIGDPAGLIRLAAATLMASAHALPLVAAAVIVVGLLAYLRLRILEARDFISDHAPELETMRAILERENHGVQNHMISQTRVKPGLLRAYTLRIAFWGIATIGPLLFPPGYLGPIGTIHFARWIQPPGTRDLIFVSNYGGSWEAYLEDFITLAHLGLTGVWSNTNGFPRSTSLIFGGATDGERFKRYARQSMMPTRFWYSAYPELITDMIRTHRDIRRGLSGVMTEDDARYWLSRFGSALRTDQELQTQEIQSLVFGGLGFLPALRLTLWRFDGETAASRSWLAAIFDEIAFGDGRKARDDPNSNSVLQIAFSAPGIARLGLPEAASKTFPIAFRDGMTGPHRARILGDIDENSSDHWWWGADLADVAVLIYGRTEADVDAMADHLQQAAARHAVVPVHHVAAKPLDRADNVEPFGFLDGVSQPVIRGTYKGLSGGDPLHLVEPGEFVLGYPDNRGNLPPVPHLDALHDPDNLLPGVSHSADFSRTTVNIERDIGRNGTYLVIRQLEQHVDRFHAYCAEQAAIMQDAIGAPYSIDADFIAAKMIGRWQNGAPLVRSPYSQSSSAAIIGENIFRLGAEDPEGLRCPFGAHIRRANPRDSLDPGSTKQIAISNRHRIMRVGRKYAPGPGQDPGLLFLAINADIERQFEFVQQTWLRGPIISLRCPSTFLQEADPLLGTSDGRFDAFSIPTEKGPLKLQPAPRFITTRGGGYYFMPGRSLLGWLSGKERRFGHRF